MSQNQVLPIIKPANPNLDFQQSKILEKFTVYMDLKRKKMKELRLPNADDCKLPFGSQFGLCSALTAYWSYCKCIGEEYEFVKQLEYVLNWDQREYESNSLLNDSCFEDLINMLVFLERDVNIRSGIKQDNVQLSFDLLLGAKQPRIAKNEVDVNFVFTHATLTQFINEVFIPNKMIRIDNGFHVIDVVFSGGVYYCYDPDNRRGPFVNFDNSKDLNMNIFHALARWCNSTRAIALKITRTDLVGKEPGPQFDSIDYYKKSLTDPNLRKIIIHHQNVFHLGMRYSDYEMLDLLFAAGYKYIPWTANEDTEYVEAVAQHNEEDIVYLAKHGIPINYRTLNGVTPLGKAIMLDEISMLYALLQAGADPLIDAVKGYSPIRVALLYKRREAFILLLACGADITPDQAASLPEVFGKDNAQIYLSHALELNKKLLNVPVDMHLETATGRDIVAFLYHAKLMLQLGYPIALVKFKEHGLTLAGISALERLVAVYNSEGNNDIYDFPEKYTMQRLFKYFDIDLFEFDGNQELLVAIVAVTKQIITKNSFTNDDAFEIAVILDELTEIKNHFSIYPSQLYLSYKAGVAKRTIEAYLARKGIKSIDDYIATLNLPMAPKATSLFFSTNKATKHEEMSFATDIEPLLSLTM